MNTNNDLKHFLIFAAFCFSALLITTLIRSSITELAKRPIGIDIKVTFAIDEKLLTKKESQ